LRHRMRSSIRPMNIIIIENEQIQCIVANQGIEDEIAFGETQKPKLWDYADGVDTLQFLQEL